MKIDHAAVRPAVHHAAPFRLARKAALVLLGCAPLLCHAVVPEQTADAAPLPQVLVPGVDVEGLAVKAAVADGVSTGLALASGAVEQNPLVATSPLGLVALTGAKVMLVKYAATLPEPDKRMVMKSTTALWGGAAVNNVLVLLSAPPPLPLVAGVVFGVMAWRNSSQAYAEQDRVAALELARQTLAKAGAVNVVPVVSALAAVSAPPVVSASPVAAPSEVAKGIDLAGVQPAGL